MFLINCEMNFILTWSKTFAAFKRNIVITFTTNAKPYVLTVTLSTQDNAKLLEQVYLAFERTIDCNQY